MRISTSLAFIALALAAAGASAASTAPDAHDRALVRQLDAQASALAGIPSQTTNLDKTLEKCAFMKSKDPSRAIAGTIALLPALLIEAVNQLRPQLVQVRDLVASMRPDSPLFARWLAAERKTLALLFQFDNGGKPIDMCKAAKVMLAKGSTPAQVEAVLGIDTGVIAKAFDGSMSAASKTVTRLNPRMRTFFMNAGLSRKHAVRLTS